AGTVGLGLALAGGMLTKFTTLVVFGVPFVVVLARRGPRAVLHELAVPAAAVSLAAILVSPFYYQRYWKPYRELFPQAMSWLEAPALKEAVAARDAHRWRFLLHVLRIPKQAIVGTQTPVTDSFIYSIWLAEPSAPQRGWARSRSDLLILALLLFMFANHLLPVYDARATAWARPGNRAGRPR